MTEPAGVGHRPRKPWRVRAHDARWEEYPEARGTLSRSHAKNPFAGRPFDHGRMERFWVSCVGTG